MKKENLILLCGQNSDNLPWLEKMGKHFEKSYKIKIQEYSHWGKDTEMDFTVELNKLKRTISKLDDYSIVAKSAGGILALMAYKEGLIDNRCKLIIIGTPTIWAEKRDIDVEPLISSDPNILYIQGTNDPKGNYSDLKKYHRFPSAIVKYYSNDHGYRKTKTMSRYIQKFLQ